MTKIFLFTLLVLSTILANASDLNCKVKDRSYSPKQSEILISQIGEKTASFSVLSGKLLNELIGIDTQLILVSQGKSINTGWTTSVYESSNFDDTHFLITVTTTDKHNTARANLQILVDGLEGGTHSIALECSLL